MIPQVERDAAATPSAGRDFLGHPRGLAVLFASEAWERFSYFGNAALVVLYMTKYLLDPSRVDTVLGLGAVRAALEFLFGRLDPQPLASQLFGFYTGLAYFTPILGGLVADRLLGQHRTVIIGGVFMAIGHFMMAFEALFLLALLMLIVGIGAFKPNISTQVGALYAPGDDRRDRAYSIFYLGINIGAFLAPLVCGTLAVQYGWHYGFAAAGVGMLVSLAIYLYGRRTLPADARSRDSPLARENKPLDAGERRAVFALVGTCALVTLFWAAYDQQDGLRLPLRHTRQSGDGGCGIERGRQGKRALACGLLRPCDHRRTSSGAGRAGVDLETRPRRHDLDHDGRLVCHHLACRHSRRLPRRLLEQHGEGELFSDDRADRRVREPRAVGGKPRHPEVSNQWSVIGIGGF